MDIDSKRHIFKPQRRHLYHISSLQGNDAVPREDSSEGETHLLKQSLFTNTTKTRTLGLILTSASTAMKFTSLSFSDHTWLTSPQRLSAAKTAPIHSLKHICNTHLAYWKIRDRYHKEGRMTNQAIKVSHNFFRLSQHHKADPQREATADANPQDLKEIISYLYSWCVCVCASFQNSHPTVQQFSISSPKVQQLDNPPILSIFPSRPSLSSCFILLYPSRKVLRPFYLHMTWQVKSSGTRQKSFNFLITSMGNHLKERSCTFGTIPIYWTNTLLFLKVPTVAYCVPRYHAAHLSSDYAEWQTVSLTLSALLVCSVK